MRFKVELEREEDGRWIAEVPELPGVLAYGASPSEAQAKVQALALRWWRIASSTVKQVLSSSISLSTLRPRR